MAVFQAADLLIPREEYLKDWAVIACDQFTSQPDYWRQVAQAAAGKPSAYWLIFPEAELGAGEEQRIAQIQRHMAETLAGQVLRSYPNSYVYVERTLLDGSIRQGVVGAVDLEAYDPADDAVAPIRATERTVMERIPPRVRIRQGAPMELSHVLLLCDDKRRSLIEDIDKTALEPLYSFQLMQGGGQIDGWLLSGPQAEAFEARMADYMAETAAQYADKAPVYFAVGDGNHSLATAKACWDQLKRQQPGISPQHPARWAMVELENLHAPAQRFEPIHRVITGVPAAKLLEKLQPLCDADGYPVRWAAGAAQGELRLSRRLGQLPVGILQPALDACVAELGGRMDYIHGDEVALQLGAQENAIAFLLPAIAKEDLFRGITLDGVLPRKTFSMGHAQEKRYYLEARRITEA